MKYTIYYLPNEHYVGVTNNLKRRLREHRAGNTSKNVVRKDTSECKVLGVFYNRADALEIERKYHEHGYKGFQFTDERMQKIIDTRVELKHGVCPIIQLNKDGSFVREFSSITEANLHFGKKFNNGGIANTLAGRAKSTYGYKWKYKFNNKYLRKETKIETR